jgi:glycosyltransferase involved in cell wall biosynthesis
LRVLYLNPFSQEVSGPDESLRTLLRTLIPMGVEAHLVLPRPGPQVPWYEALGVKIHYAPLTILKRRPGLSAALLPLSLARGVSAIIRIARRERIDLIHTNMEVVLDGSVASRMLHLPHVLHYRGNTNDDPKVVFDVLTRFWSATAEKVFCISDATADLFRWRGLTAKVDTLYNPVDIEAFAEAERSDQVRQELGAHPSDLLIGTVGRIHPRKDVETFIRSAALVARDRADSRFVVVGTAEAPEEVAYEKRLRGLAAELGIGERLTWAGARRDMPRVMKALDVFALCSRKEGFGRVVAEAMAAEVPCIVTNDGALPEVLGNDSPRQYPAPGSSLGFATAILDLLNDGPYRASEASRGRARASTFAVGQVARAAFQTYLALARRT